MRMIIIKRDSYQESFTEFDNIERIIKITLAAMHKIFSDIDLIENLNDVFEYSGCLADANAEVLDKEYSVYDQRLSTTISTGKTLRKILEDFSVYIIIVTNEQYSKYNPVIEYLGDIFSTSKFII